MPSDFKTRANFVNSASTRERLSMTSRRARVFGRYLTKIKYLWRNRGRPDPALLLMLFESNFDKALANAKATDDRRSS